MPIDSGGGLVYSETMPGEFHKENGDLAPIVREVSVPVAPSLAFDHFVQDLGAWWPRDYTWAGKHLVAIVMEGRVNGRCYEIGPHGFHLDWGRVLVFEPPRQLAFTWQIGGDRVPIPHPDRAGRVLVTFTPNRDESWTTVTLTHDGFNRYRSGAEAYRAAMASREGWMHLLALYGGYCG